VYARSLSDAQQQSAAAIATASRASAELSAARSAQAGAAQADAAAAGIARAASLPPPVPTASRYQGAIDDAAQQLRRAQAANDQAHEQQRNAARTAGAALGQASHEGIRNASWMHHFTHAVGHWASTQWAGALRELSKVASVVSVLAGLSALVLSVAGIFFPPLEAAAAVLETISLVSAFVAASADTMLAATGKGSWTAVGLDALTLLPTGLAKVVTKAAPAIREGRLLRPTSVAHASSGDATKLRSLRTLGHAPGASYSRVVNCAPDGVDAEWGFTAAHIEKHFFGADTLSLSQIDPAGNVEVWLSHLRELATRPHTALRNDGIEDIMGSFAKTDGSGSFRLGLRVSPKDDGTFDLVTVLTAQRK
jgi:hypothetical protein